MSILAECPVCHLKQNASNRLCTCGENLVKAKRSNRVRFWISYRLPGGKQKRESVGFSITEAQDAEGKRRVQKRENRIFDVKPEANMTFEELTKYFLKMEQVKAKAYYKTLEINLASFNKVFGNTKVKDIKKSDLENYQAIRKKQGLSDSYVDQEIGAARSIIYKAFDDDLISFDHVKVFKKVKKLLKKNSNARKRVLSSEEFKKLMDALPLHTKAIIAMGYYTGMRKGEIVNLTWDRVKLKKRVIKLTAQDTKDREARDIPICDALYKILKSIPVDIRDNHVFLFKGKPVRDIRFGIENACKEAGIPYGRKEKDGFVFHDTRHCFNTNMRKSGAAESVIMKITGHSTREMFLRYDTVDTEDTHKAVGQMEEFLKSVDQNVDQVPLNEEKG
ncbi:MAG: site-specific integrase [Smithella sp.]|nr:site-specific integrase [Smithella sp.]